MTDNICETEEVKLVKPVVSVDLVTIDNVQVIKETTVKNISKQQTQNKVNDLIGARDRVQEQLNAIQVSLDEATAQLEMFTGEIIK